MNLLLIQARMGSSRLPGKVLKEIAGVPILKLLIERVKPSKHVNNVVVATTLNSEDDVIEDFCKKEKIHFFRGSDWDVLDRFYNAAYQYSAANVIRITSDCPLNNFEVIDFAIEEYLNSKCDYFSNSNCEPHVIEDGIDVEVFSFESLKHAWKNAKLISEREHVTPFIKNSGLFKCYWKKYHPDYNFKLSVDTIEDYEAVSALIEKSGFNLNLSIKDVCEIYFKNPDVSKLNEQSTFNSGYKKSIENDKLI